MAKGFSPVGLRVLVVDDDPTWLKILERMLKKCSYEVTTCGLAREALRLLRERKEGYDIVISDVNMPDMDGFKLLEHVGLELDLPVIMMSVDGETSRVMKGVQHGACDYLLKPIRMKELKIIWQHVLRKKLQEVRDIEGYEGAESIWMTRNGFDHSDGEDVCFGKKRKDFEKRFHDERELGDSSATKKARVVWSFELHQKFVSAVNQIGCDHKAGPKKILDLMNVPWLTRENVASHLQKYRLYLSRLEKGKELKSYSGGVKQVDSPPKDAEMSSGHQSPGKIQTPGGNSVLAQKATDIDPKTLAAPVSDLSSDLLMAPQAKKTRIGFASDVSSSAFESLLPKQYSWNDVPEAVESKPVVCENSFLQQQPLPSQSCYVANSAPSEEIKSCYKSTCVAPVVCENSFPHQQPLPSQSCYVANSAPSEEINSCYENTCVAPVNVDNFLMQRDKGSSVTFQEQELGSTATNNTESILRSLNWELPGSDLDLCWLQGERFLANSGFQNIQFQDYSSPSLLSDFPPHLYDRLPDPDDYSFLVDQGLFIS